MLTFNNEVMGELLAGSLETAGVENIGWHDNNVGGGTTDGNNINWLTFNDNAKSAVDDVERIRNSPMVPSSIPI